ncbi:response regulator [Pseudoxanthomonas sp. Root630]|uniref:response regulator n=1 Tax=Pseudoxanthomonas sp. Root630 TaxID=1736574 RepID=UPI0009D780A5
MSSFGIVLIVEDDRAIAASIGEFLESRGMEVDYAADGAEGYLLAVDNRYDAIVLDGNLPRMDGLEVVRRLRGEARIATPVIMVTARDTLQDKLDGLQQGVDDYLTASSVRRPTSRGRESQFLSEHHSCSRRTCTDLIHAHELSKRIARTLQSSQQAHGNSTSTFGRVGGVQMGNHNPGQNTAPIDVEGQVVATESNCGYGQWRRAWRGHGGHPSASTVTQPQ